MKGWSIVLVVLLGQAAAVSAQMEAEVRASPPRGVMLSIYDTGVTLVSELRSVTLAKGTNQVRFSALPVQLEAGSLSFSALGGPGPLDALDLRFLYDPADPLRLLARFLQRPVEVVAASGSRKGVLVAAAGSGSGTEVPLAVRWDDGSLSVYPSLDAVEQIRFPEARNEATLEPTLLCRLSAAQEGPVNLRMWYTTRGLGWELFYEALPAEGGREISLLARAALNNRSGGDFENARVQLVSTGRGGLPPLFPRAADRDQEGTAPPLRYTYGGAEPVFEQTALSAAALQTLEVPGSITLKSGETRYVQVFRVEKMPVTRFFVYDGVRFDRFQRNRRTDWNYGTEFHRAVEMRLAFDNQSSSGLGFDLPPGRIRYYSRREDGTVDLSAESRLPLVAAGESSDLLLGPARGLRGERERTGYNEVVPMREYEESFEIRLANDTTEEAEVRVVEHLYRGEQFDIVKADTDYTKTGAQTIEFRPVLTAGGRRSVHYTVRYRW